LDLFEELVAIEHPFAQVKAKVIKSGIIGVVYKESTRENIAIQTMEKSIRGDD